jgi:Ni,Fe-hydrogenase III large subunit/Ni,Fe-hydrogenase III component G
MTEVARKEADRVVGAVPDPSRVLHGARSYSLAPEALRPAVERAVAAGWRFASLVADEPSRGEARLDYLFVAPGLRSPLALCLHAGPEGVPSVALACPAASWAEREVKDLHGVTFTGSPDPRPLVHHEDWPEGLAPLKSGVDPLLPVERTQGAYPYRHVEGEGVMEIRVGPIHAGIIEPGHFRFTAVGETVLGLEIRLFFVHRGVEKLAQGKTPAAALVIAERVSGAGSVAHSLAAARAMEAALGVEVPASHAMLRSLLLELERLYNHAGDLGNLCAGTALSVVLAEGLIVKEHLLELNQSLSGSRYLRNLIGFGGVRRMPSAAELEKALSCATLAMGAVEHLAEKLFGSATNLERLSGTGVLSPEHVQALGVVGVVARGSGVRTDSRADLAFPSKADAEIYGTLTVVTDSSADVAARAQVRLAEARESLRLCQGIVAMLGHTDPAAPGKPGRQAGEGLGWAEGARGEVLTYARLEEGRLARLRIRSPSRMNWPAIEHAMPGNIVPDFPLINKSFNLSYAGCDL